MAIDFTELRELLGIISQSNITELNLKTDEFELSISKAIATGLVTTQVNAIPVESASPVTDPSIPAPAPTSPQESPPAPSTNDSKRVAITSPMVGTFYRAPAPDEDSFVEEGDGVQKGQVLCIIEAMKLMNEIEAEVNGKVVEIVAENGEPVEYGQTLMWIMP